MQVGFTRMSFGSERGIKLEEDYNNARSKVWIETPIDKKFSYDDRETRKTILSKMLPSMRKFIKATKEAQKNKPILDTTDIRIMGRISAEIALNQLIWCKDIDKQEKVKKGFEDIYTTHDNAQKELYGEEA